MKSIFNPAIFLALFFSAPRAVFSQCLVFSAVADDCDFSSNDPLFWNHSDWWDALIESHDLSDAPVNLSITVTDTCSGATPAPLEVKLLMDLDGNNTLETELPSGFVDAAGFIRYKTLIGTGGQGFVRQFDFRPVAADLRFRFELRQQILPDGKRRTSLMWTDKTAPNPDNPNDWTLPQLPYGKYKIQWFLSGNLLVERAFEIRDCKLPTVVCHQGLSANYMPTGRLTFWGSDLLHSALDNHTPSDQLVFSVRKAGTGTGFPVDSQGNPIPGVTFFCMGDWTGIKPIELWVKDKHGNLGVCQTDLNVQDPFNNCQIDPKPEVIACLKTESGEKITDATVMLTGTHPVLPPLNFFSNAVNADGCLTSKNVVPVSMNVVVTPMKDDNPANGVTTYDLLLMARHILGVTIIQSPYKIIAADVNKNGSVTTNDIVELRKLILGIYTDLPQNNSWRFVLKNHVFSNPLNPFSPAFPESSTLMDLLGDTSIDFIGMKTGDINGNAIANNFAASDDRAPHTFLIENQKLKSGKEYILPVGNGSQNQISGFQMGLKIDPTAAVLQDILPAAAADFSAENFATSPDGSVSISWFEASSTTRTATGEPLFFLKIKALRDSRLSEILSLDESRLLPEVYNAAADLRKLDLQFFEKSRVGESFLLFPNPTSGEVFLEMKNSPSSARFEIFDALGRSLRRGELIEQRTRLDVSDFPAGQFFFKILSSGEVSSLVFFKN